MFGLLSATLFLVYEHRPKLMLSAATLGRSVRNMGGRVGDSGGGDRYETYDRSGSWGGGSSSVGGGGGRPRGALTEMVMGSEIGSVGGDAMYSLLEEHEDEDGDDDRRLEGQREEEDRGARRSV